MPGVHDTRIVAIFGPTAVGKSRVAVEVARALDGEIVSADSMQVYAGLPVLTDQPSPEAMAEVPHHLVAEVPLDEEYSAARYCREARSVIEDVARRGKLPLLVGGTGLYIRGLLGGLSFAARPASNVRRRWEKFIREKGKAAARLELERLDPDAAATVDSNNPRRLARALEAAASAGPSVASERHKLWSPDSAYRVYSFALESPRAALYQAIDDRVDKMFSSGAVEEVRLALRGDVSRTAAQAIGFKEIREYLDGGVTLEQAAEAIKAKSRRYAKRQLTWMRKMPDIVRIDVAGRTPIQAAGEILSRLRHSGFIS